MASHSPSSILSFLQERQFLTKRQLDKLPRSPKVTDGPTLLRELIRREWLTLFQANCIATGNAHELILGPYRLLEPLGEGGMGKVFKARQVHMDRIVALKIIPPEYVANPNALSRFYREVRAIAQLAHPNIVTAYEANQDGNTFYLAMELVEGIDLARLVRQSGPLSIQRACEFMRQAALGLQHAHEKGLVHRDIKPGNLIVGRGADGRPVVRLLDFGLARFEEPAAHGTRLTQLGHVLGTVDYISPEQAGDARVVDIRADIYSLGCSLFYVLTGKPPFEGADSMEKTLTRLVKDAPSVGSLRAEVPAAVEQVVARMLARRPEARYQTPAEVAAALEPFARPSPPTGPVAVSAAPLLAQKPGKVWESNAPMRTTRRRPFVLLGVLLFCVGLGVVSWMLWKTREPASADLGATNAERKPFPKAVVPKSNFPDPVARWTFDKDVNDSVAGIKGTLYGGAHVSNGRLRLNGTAHLRTELLPFTLRERTLTVWLTIADLGLGESYLMELLGPSEWDGIIFARKQPRRWYPGSHHDQRSQILTGPDESARPNELIHLAAVYRADNSITFYRNGKVYGGPFVPHGGPFVPQLAGPALQTYEKGKSYVIFGSNTGSGFAGTIKEARIYNVALTQEQISSLYTFNGAYEQGQ